MLADEILAHANYPLMRELMGPIYWKEAVRRAVRFEMLPTVIQSARVLQGQPLDARLRALAIARVPYQCCWFEWPGMPRAPIRADGVPSADDRRPEEFAPQPRRMGALIETDESCQRGTISFAWVHGPDDDIQYCPLGFQFDFTAEPGPIDCMTREDSLRSLAEWRRTGKIDGRYNNSSIEAVADYIRRIGVIPSPLTPHVFDPARMAQMAHPDLYYRSALLDVTGEDDSLLSLLILINARNLVSVTDRPAPPKLNRARAKRGKPPLLDFHEVRISLSRTLATRAGAGMSDGRNRAETHIVRGHFKIRASGVYWWSPHVRGDGRGGPVVPKYTVTS